MFSVARKEYKRGYEITIGRENLSEWPMGARELGGDIIMPAALEYQDTLQYAHKIKPNYSEAPTDQYARAEKYYWKGLHFTWFTYAVCTYHTWVCSTDLDQ